MEVKLEGSVGAVRLMKSYVSELDQVHLWTTCVTDQSNNALPQVLVSSASLTIEDCLLK